MYNLSLCSSTIGVILAPFIWRAFVSIIWRPLSITRRLRKQGVKGPDFKFFSGNLDEIKNLKMEARTTELDIKSHDITFNTLPHYVNWTSKYGEVFLYWFGLQPRICITDMELVKQILSDKSGSFVKPKTDPRLLALLGRGLFFAEGEEWDMHRKVISPAFTMNKLKGMTKEMVGCATTMLDKWEALTKQGAAIEVQKHFVEITTDVISHTVFGSSYNDCKEIFLAQRELLNNFMASGLSIQIPGLCYMPTKSNLRKWELQRKMKEAFVSIIEKRLSSNRSSYNDDLLDLLIESSRNQQGTAMSIEEIIAECKTFFFGGQETTAQLLTWTMFLLSTNQDWQEKLRNEVFAECGMEAPKADNISQLKTMHMVMLEALRLYCPIIVIARENALEIKLGDITLPKNLMLTVPFPIIHRKKELWGENANEFNPMRFEDGVVKAAIHPNALMSFSLGPRACIGQNFTIMETKTIIAMILQRFTFVLSPDYKHLPTDMLTLQPLFGLPIVFNPLK